MSESTRRVDEYEKREAYLSISSLSVYILLEQNSASALVYRRADQGFEREYYDGLDAVIPLPEIDCQLSLTDVYANVKFSAPASEDE